MAQAARSPIGEHDSGVSRVNKAAAVDVAGKSSGEERDVVAVAGGVADEEVFSAEVAHQIAFAQADELSAERTGDIKDFKLVVGAENLPGNDPTVRCQK
jgi:hypothetical protein